MEPVVSGHTTRETLKLASTLSEAEQCLPNKIFDGHLVSIMDEVDAVFIPRVISMVKGHISCPKFGALPDACAAGVAHGKKIISVEINETREPLEKSFLRLARQLGASRGVARKTVAAAFATLKERELEEAEKQRARTDGHELLSNVVDEKLFEVWLAEGVAVSSRRPGMPEEGRRFKDVPWPKTGREPLSGFGWGVFERPDPIAEGDSTSLANDLVKRAMIKRLPS